MCITCFLCFRFELTGVQISDEIPGQDHVELLKIMTEKQDDTGPADNKGYDSKTEATVNQQELGENTTVGRHEIERRNSSTMAEIHSSVSTQDEEHINVLEQEENNRH